MKTWLLLLGCLLAFTSSAQSSRREVWQWKDANGVTLDKLKRSTPEPATL